MVCTNCQRPPNPRLKKGLCLSCYNTAWAKGRASVKIRVHEYYRQNEEKLKARSSEWAKENPEATKISKIKYSKSEKGRSSHRLTQRNRTERLKRQTPPWADALAIKAFYGNRPAGMTVDHIVPICGLNVSGLHTVENLQYLTREGNIAKGRSFNTEVTYF